MGSKNLKAVVIRGGKLPEVGNPNHLERYQVWFKKKMMESIGDLQLSE